MASYKVCKQEQKTSVCYFVMWCAERDMARQRDATQTQPVNGRSPGPGGAGGGAGGADAPFNQGAVVWNGGKVVPSSNASKDDVRQALNV
jgi:hypothetical protein